MVYEKYIKENSFKQEEAFNELVDITKKTGTIDELKDYLNRWEKKYSINDKFTIDDFIKHQSEVKRFTSDEFLQSIAREEPKIDDANELIEEYNDKTFSDLSIQASAYAALVSISNSPNSVDEMFKWVYKNSNIKFNDKYKELILNATYLNYSPMYLKKLQKPEIDMAKSTLSYDEYKNINETKRYAIISYFNLLLPQNRAIANDYFNKNIETIYKKSEQARSDSLEKSDKTEFDYDTIVALSPLFFRTVECYDEQFNYDKHLAYVNVVDSAVDKYLQKDEKSQNIEENTIEIANTNLS